MGGSFFFKASRKRHGGGWNKKLLKAHLSDRCDKVRQMLRPLLPNGFIPHPMKVRLNEDTGTFSIAQDASSDPFLSLATRALYHGMAEMPFDTFTSSMNEKLDRCGASVIFVTHPNRRRSCTDAIYTTNINERVNLTSQTLLR